MSHRQTGIRKNTELLCLVGRAGKQGLRFALAGLGESNTAALKLLKQALHVLDGSLRGLLLGSALGKAFV